MYKKELKRPGNKKDAHRQSDISTVKDAIKGLLEHYRLQQKFDETTLISSWERVMGQGIASRTKRIFIKDKKLFLEVTSAPLKNQLQLGKSRIIEIFNQEIGQDVIMEVILL